MKKRGHPTEDKIDEEGDHEVSCWAGRGLAQGRLWGIPPSSCSEPDSRTFAIDWASGGCPLPWAGASV